VLGSSQTDRVLTHYMKKSSMAKKRAAYLPPIEGSARVAKTFYLLGAKGEKIFPVQMKDLKTGRVAFRLAIPGSRCNIRANAIEVTDELSVYRMVATGNYLIRAQREGDRGPGYFRVGGRSPSKLVLIEPAQTATNPQTQLPS